MGRVKCIHYNTCIASEEYLCIDPKCPLNKKVQKKEDDERLEAVRKLLDERRIGNDRTK